MHENPVGTLTLNCRLAHAGFIDTATDDLNRLFDRGISSFLNSLVGKRYGDQSVVSHVDIDILIIATDTENAACNRIRQTANQTQCLLTLLVAENPNLERLHTTITKSISHAFAAQAGAHRIDNRLDPFLDQRFDVDLEQQVRSTLQVKAKANLLVR